MSLEGVGGSSGGTGLLDSYSLGDFGGLMISWSDETSLGHLVLLTQNRELASQGLVSPTESLES